MSIGDAEIKTQERVIRFFKDPEILGYQYIGNLSDYQNKNIKEDRLRQYLRLKGYADKLIDAAVMQLQQEAGNLSRGVYDANKTVYSRLKYGIPVSESPEKPPVTVELIDEANPLNNDFAIAEEVTVVEQQEKRPDLVIYLNGIAVAVIELKRSSISVSEGIRQNLTNQKDSFIRGFFTTMQFCMAGNESEGLRYGTLLTGEKFYMEWKDDGFKEHEEERDPVDVRISKTCEVIDNKLLKQIYAMFDKERFIDLIMNFVVFDKGIKKVCRYNQYFGIKRTQQRLNNLRTELHNPNRDQDKPLGGILWHTQGSGKTLTMVWLAKWILTHWAELNARVLIVTDRDALTQIHEAHGNPGSFSNVNPSTDNWINGFFGIGGFYLCCVANFDSARSEVVFARAERSENKAAFDALYQHKSEIESKLGTELQWNRGDDIKSSKVFIQLDKSYKRIIDLFRSNSEYLVQEIQKEFSGQYFQCRDESEVLRAVHMIEVHGFYSALKKDILDNPSFSAGIMKLDSVQLKSLVDFLNSHDGIQNTGFILLHIQFFPFRNFRFEFLLNSIIFIQYWIKMIHPIMNYFFLHLIMK